MVTNHVILYRIWTHPYLIIEHEREEERKQLMQDDDDFVVADDDLELEDDDEKDNEDGNADELMQLLLKIINEIQLFKFIF